MATTKTPVMGLNKPARGDFEWDVPLNENWDKLDKLGAGQLPLLSWIDVDYVLTGDAALGWALQGSTLDGNTYTSLWDLMKAAYDRSVAKNEEHYGKTYSVRTDATTGLRFVTETVFNQAFNDLGESLGHVVDTANSAKKIILRKAYRSYDLPGTWGADNVGTMVDEQLPNIKGSIDSDPYGMYKSADGCFAVSVNQTSASGSNKNYFSKIQFDASRSSSAYKDGARVMPQTKYVLRYYKVGNTIVNQDQIDLGNLTKEIQNLQTGKANTNLSNISSNIDYVIESGGNSDKWYRKYKSGWLEQGGYLTEGSNQTVTLLKPYKDTKYVISAIGEVNGCRPAMVTAGSVTVSSFQVNTRNYTDTVTASIKRWKTEGYGA